jgi:signal peptidase I
VPRILEHAIEARPATSSVISTQALERTAHFQRTLRQTVRLLIQALVFAALVSLFFFRVPQVEGRSMQPNIESGNHVLINTLSYGVALGPWVITSSAISRGDIIAFERGRGDDARIFLKRVIALPGETVAISNGAVMVQGQPLLETYDRISDNSNMSAVSVPAGTVFVLGDNRAESDDSRSFGPIPQSSIIGKASFIIWPLGHVKRIN